MKSNVLKIVAILLVILAVILIINNSNKLTATRTVEEDGTKYEVKMEVKFKNGEANSAKATLTFESEDEAKKTKEQLDQVKELGESFSGEEMNFEYEQKGKKIIMNVDSELISNSEGPKTKKEMKEALEEQGFKVH